MAILLSSILTEFTRYKRDLSDVSSATFVDWCRYINNTVYRKVAGTDTERFISTESYTVSSAPQTSALPAAFKSIKEHGLGFFEVDSNSEDTQRTLTRTGFGSGIKGYYITGTNVVFTGIDDSTVYKMRYLAEITQLSATTEYFTTDGTVDGTEIIPDEYHDFLIKALDVMYDQWDEDIGAEGFADARYTRLLDEFLIDVKKDPADYANFDYTLNF